jgi:hypothetical protein
MPADVVPIRPDPPTAPARPSSVAGSSGAQPSYAISGWWTPARLRAALDANDAGSFDAIEALRSNLTRDARVGGQGGSRGQRIATPLGLPRELKLPEGYESNDKRSPAARVLDAALALLKDGAAFGPLVQAHLEGELADFGVGYGVLTWVPTGGGGAMMPRFDPWPLSATRFDEERGEVVAMLADGTEEPLTPGDGRWVRVASTLVRPWEDGAVRSISSAVMSRAYSDRDANRFQEAAGQNPLIGTVPTGTQDKERDQFIADTRGLATGRQVGVKYDGYEWERLASNAEQATIFLDWSKFKASDAAIGYVGQDGTAAKGDTGTYGAVAVLDGVRYDLVERDVAQQSAAFSQIAGPFAFYNFGRADLAPTLFYAVPDPEEDARAKAERDEARLAREAFHKELASLRASGASLDAKLVMEVATAHAVTISDAMAEAIAAGMAVKAEQSAQAAKGLAGGSPVG